VVAQMHDYMKRKGPGLNIIHNMEYVWAGRVIILLFFITYSKNKFIKKLEQVIINFLTMQVIISWLILHYVFFVLIHHYVILANYLYIKK
jgi:hypothetical protein